MEIPLSYAAASANTEVGQKESSIAAQSSRLIIFRFGFIVLSSLKLWVVTACKRKKARPAREKPQAKRALCSLSEQPKRTDLSCLSVCLSV